MSDGSAATPDEEQQAARAHLRAAAAAATPGPWEAWQNLHAEYEVSQAGRRNFAMVASPARGPEDYGRANAEFIAAADPVMVTALLDDLAAAQAKIRRLAGVHYNWFGPGYPGGTDGPPPDLVNLNRHLLHALGDDVIGPYADEKQRPAVD